MPDRLTAKLLTRVARHDGTLVRVVDIDGQQDKSFTVQVGGIVRDGVEMLDDLKVAKLVIEELHARGWDVDPGKNLQGSALVKPKEAAVMQRTFTIFERN